jgi:predicted metal-binding membrane protein
MSAVAATSAAPRPARVPRPVIATIALAWALTLAADATGRGRLLHHDVLLGGEVPYGVALALFVASWQAMVAAMMIPGSLPLVRLFTAASAAQPRPGRALAAFLGGYAVVWTAFGFLALSGDAFVHTAVDASPWLRDHTALIGAGVLATAGAFQFSALKDRCLSECRHPAAFLLRHYRRGTGAAFGLGRRHGLFCAGCCWALMLLMFAAGVSNLWWMVALTTLMLVERTAPAGARAVPVAGVVLLACAALVLADPAWLPPLVGGARP